MMANQTNMMKEKHFMVIISLSGIKIERINRRGPRKRTTFEQLTTGHLRYCNMTLKHSGFKNCTTKWMHVFEENRHMNQ